MVKTTTVHTAVREKTCAEVRYNHEMGACSFNDRHSQSHAVHLCVLKPLYASLLVSPSSCFARFCSFVGPWPALDKRSMYCRASSRFIEYTLYLTVYLRSTPLWSGITTSIPCGIGKFCWSRGSSVGFKGISAVGGCGADVLDCCCCCAPGGNMGLLSR
jgi:hypothetical protein